jgi:hypothetical protein
VPDIPHIPTHAKNINVDEWVSFFEQILDEPNFSESGILLTFVSMRSRGIGSTKDH